MSLAVEEIGELEWRTLLESSPQASLFTSPEFLAAAGGAVAYLAVRRRGRLVAGSIVDRSGAARWLELHSVMLTPEAHLGSNRGSYAVAEATATLLEQVVEQAAPRARRMSFHPSIRDHRPACWVLEDHEHTSSWRPRSTGIVTLPVREVRGSTRRRVAAGARSGLVLDDSGSVADLVEVLEGCRIQALVDEVEWIASVSESLVAQDMARVVVVRSKEDPETSAATLAVRWRDSVYLLFGAARGAHPSWSSIRPLLDDAIIGTAERAGCSEVDLVGANHRRRAQYKAGWMSELRSWLEVTWWPPE